jgi:hypothetical protein
MECKFLNSEETIVLPNHQISNYIYCGGKKTNWTRLTLLVSFLKELDKKRFKLDRSKDFISFAVKFNKVRDLLHNIKEEKKKAKSSKLSG